MIQFIRDNDAVLYTLNTIYLNLYDEMTSIDYEPLIELKSQMTNKSLTYISGGTTNLVVANTVKTIWKGLLNLKAVNNNAVTYTENSSTISSPTYITNVIDNTPPTP